MNLQELPKLRDSISYLYIEHAVIEKDRNAVIAFRKNGKIPIPIAAMTCLLIGPGVSITHDAVRVLCENGCMAIWCGENMGRFYASGLGETRSAKNLLLQAKLCMNQKSHMRVARRMYAIRFPNMDTDHLALNQIRGMEGIRVRKAYELASKLTGVPWDRRKYKKDNWDEADPINKALSEGNALLYGVCHAAVVSLGYSPGLGFIHTGKQLSFVYDIADLYKAETTIPAAFEAVQRGGNIEQGIRMICRTYFSRAKILSRIADDIAWLFSSDEPEEEMNASETGDLWDREQTLRGGVNYAGEGD